MNVFTLDEPRSLRRYIKFGIVAGVIAGTLAAVLGVSLVLVGALAAAVAGGLAGHVSSERLPEDRRSHVFSSAGPGFAIITIIAILAVGIGNMAGIRGTGGMESDSGMWVLLALSVVCFGALVMTNWK